MQRSSLSRFAGRVVMPVAAIETGWQAVAVVLALAGGGTLLGVKLGTATGIAITLAIIVALLALAGYETQKDLDLRESRAPHLVVGEPFTRVSIIRGSWGPAKPAKHGCFVLVPLANTRAEGSADGTDARDVHVRLRVVSETGATLAEWQQARWSDAQQKIEQSEYAPDHTPELTERTLPPNKRSIDIDTVVQFQDRPGCDLWLQSGVHHLGVSEPFFVEMEICGSNFPDECARIRVEPGDASTFDPTVSLA